MKLAGAVVLYHPDKDVVENIKSYLHGLDKLYILDNTEQPDEGRAADYRALPGAEYIPYGENRGISAALNDALSRAEADGADYLLTMDQDSRFEPGDFEKYLAAVRRVLAEHPRAAAIGTHYTLMNPSEAPVERVETLITSGTLVKISASKEIGGFDENLFIDEVDNEFCYRAGSRGYECYLVGAVTMRHHLGNPRTIAIGGGVSLPHFRASAGEEILHLPEQPLRDEKISPREAQIPRVPHETFHQNAPRRAGEGTETPRHLPGTPGRPSRADGENQGLITRIKRRFSAEIERIRADGLLWEILGLYGRLTNKIRNRVLFGKGVHIGSGAKISGHRHIRLGRNFSAGKHLWMDAIESYPGQQFHPQIEIGDNVSLSDFCHIGATHHIKIGNNVLFGSKCYVTDHLHGAYSGAAQTGPETPPAKRALTETKAVIIEDNVWIGDNVVILPGVTIGFGAVIGANAVVTKDIPLKTIAVGAPAKVIKRWDETSCKWERI